METKKKSVFICPDGAEGDSQRGTNKNVLPHGKGMAGGCWQRRRTAYVRQIVG